MMRRLAVDAPNWTVIYTGGTWLQSEDRKDR